MRIILFLMGILFFNFNSFIYSQDTKFGDNFNKFLIKSLNRAKYEDIDAKQFAKKHNLSSFFTKYDPVNIFGFIGPDLQRIKVNVSKVEQSKGDSQLYLITGKTKVSNNIQSFKGEMKLQNVYSFKEPLTQHGLVICAFKTDLTETGNSEHTGTFKGYYYLVLSKVVEEIRYPKAIPKFLQNYTFAGYWTSKSGILNYPVLWGENYLFEELEDFYYGISGKTAVSPEIIDKHWQNYFDAFTDGTKADIKNRALKLEKEVWWK